MKGANLREKIRSLLGQSPEELGNAQWIGHLLKRLQLTTLAGGTMWAARCMPLSGDGAFPSLPFYTPIPLPASATPFIGRTDELAEIGTRLEQPACHLLTLVGPGGMGKTRLALAAGQRQQNTFIDVSSLSHSLL